MATRGQRRHRLTLEDPGQPVADGDGGYTQAWTALSPAYMQAEIKTATVRDLERLVASTVQSTATHIVTMDYHPQVTTKTRLTKGPRNTDGTLPSGSIEFAVTGVDNTEKRNIELVLTCEEVVT